jgi:cell wall-associated NlpC family hydrolase
MTMHTRNHPGSSGAKRRCGTGLAAGLLVALSACCTMRQSHQLSEPHAAPVKDLGADAWGLGCVSLANAREQPSHKAEMATQVFLGSVVRLRQQAGRWFRVETDDGYQAWMETESFFPCDKAAVERWEASPLLIVTAFEDCVREQPRSDAPPVSDVVLGGRVKKTGEAGDWYGVELPDHRAGFLPKSAATDYAAWKQSRRATPENIERTARQLLGRPYLWGANSPRGLDCSGLTKLVFFLNGIALPRNASQQARAGAAVPLDQDLSRLRTGDLVFFGHRARGNRPERVTHVGIYLGDKLFIHASQRVRINSLDPASPLCDAERARRLLKARRVLPES